MRAAFPCLVLGTLAVVLTGCGNNLNTPQNFWNVALTSNSSQSQTLNFSFFANIAGTSMTGSGVSFVAPSPCFGNSANPTGVVISGQVTPNTNTPGTSTLTMTMTWTDTSGINKNTLTMQGEISNGFGTTTGQGNYTLFGNTAGCTTNDSGTFFLQTAF